jgi:two-component system sensor histidine kinase BaeS
LLAAAAGIVAVSLLLSGALTWLLVRNLEVQAAQDQLDRAIVAARPAVVHLQCFNPPPGPAQPGGAFCRLADPAEYMNRLNGLSPTLNADRLILLGRDRTILYDSQGQDTLGQVITVVASKRIANVGEAHATFGGQSYLIAASSIPPTRDPVGAAYIVLAVPMNAVATAAAGELVGRLMLAAGAALLVAMLLALLLSRSLTRPLSQLAGAAEDIAAGHYSRRVGISGPDEIGKLGSAFDRMAEAVERARKVQRDFLANVSHELKTPLTSLIGFSQALVDGSIKTDKERRQAATIVHEESERVLRMAQELLDLARVETGAISIHLAPVDLGGQLEQELEVIRPRAASRELEVTLSVPPQLSPVTADAERLHQVLDNLLDNAVKYAPPGARIAVTAEAVGDAIEITVANPTGEHRPDPQRMFDRFYRADPSRSAAAGGVGLGLAISRELVAAMGGRMWAEIDAEGNLQLHVSLPSAPGGATSYPAENLRALPIPSHT